MCFLSLEAKDGKSKDDTYLWVGCLDEEFLCGQRVGEAKIGEQDDAHAHVHAQARDGSAANGAVTVGTLVRDAESREWGRRLCEPNSNIFCQNEIEGVTSMVKGDKFWQYRTGPRVEKAGDKACIRSDSGRCDDDLDLVRKYNTFSTSLAE